MSLPIARAEPLVSVVICAYTEARWDDLLAAIDQGAVVLTDPVLGAAPDIGRFESPG